MVCDVPLTICYCELAVMVTSHHHNISTLHPTMSGGMSVPLLGDEEDNDFNTGNRFQPCYVYKVSDVSFWLCACTFESPITFKVLKKKGGSYEKTVTSISLLLPEESDWTIVV